MAARTVENQMAFLHNSHTTLERYILFQTQYSRTSDKGPSEIELQTLVLGSHSMSFFSSVFS